MMTSANTSHPATPLRRRLICTLTLVALVPAVSGTLIAILDRIPSKPGWLSVVCSEHGFNGVFAALCVLAALILWRSFVVWTMGRQTLTGTLALVPFIQVAIAQPMWNSGGCGSDTVLNLSQEQVSIGAWIWLTIWAWWGLETAHAGYAGRRRRIMPANARCIIAAIGSLPFLFGVYWITGQAIDDFVNPHSINSFVLAYVVAALVAVPLWMTIWRRRVAWTPRAATWTLALATVLIGLPILILILFHDSGIAEMLAVVPVIGWGVWMALTGCLWPYKPDADVRPPSPACLSCGYELTGLTHTRCPECGDERTLDELWTAPRENAI